MSLRRRGVQLRRQRVPGTVEWAYEPHERQIVFHKCPATFKLYGGSMGGGKSVALCAEAIKLSLKYPGNRGYFARHQLVDFKRSTLVTFDQVCPPEFLRGHYRDERTILFRNGSEILYGGLGGEEDIERIKSTEFGWFGIDEASETYEEMFIMLATRLRWKLRDGTAPRYHGILASNPEPGWVKERFVDQALDDHAFIPALPRDNPHLRAGYVKDLAKMFSKEWAARYLDGSWDVFEGQVYKEFERKKHLYDHIDMGRHWAHMRSIDHGVTNPTACLWIAVDHDGRMWVYDEHYEAEKTIDHHAAVIRAKYPDFSGITVCDPSMFDATMQARGRRWSPADEYRENGIVLSDAVPRISDISEGVAINMVRQRLATEKPTGVEGQVLPMLMIHRDCKNLIREIIKYRWKHLKASDRGSKNAPEVPVDYDNHALDAIKVAALYRPMSAPKPSTQPIPGTMHYEILKIKKQLGSSGFIGWS